MTKLQNSLRIFENAKCFKLTLLKMITSGNVA